MLFTMIRHFFYAMARGPRLLYILLSTNRSIVFLLIFCIAVSFLAMQFILSPVAVISRETAGSSDTDSYSLDFSEGGISEESFARLRAVFHGRLLIADKPLHSGFYGTLSKDQPALLGVKNFSGNFWYVHAEGRQFTQEEEDQSARVAILARMSGAYPWNDFNLEAHTHDIAGAPYKIVGLGEFGDASMFFIGKQQVYEKFSGKPELQARLDEAFANHDDGEIEKIEREFDRLSQTALIPYTTYEAGGFIPNVAVLMFDGLAGNERPGVYAELQRLFPDAAVTAPLDAVQSMDGYMRRRVTLSLCMSLSCLLFLYALFAFWRRQNLGAMRSCRMVGASGRTMTGLLYLSWWALLAAGYGLSLLAGWLLDAPLASIQLTLQIAPSYHAMLFLLSALVTTLFVRLGSRGQEWREMVS